MIMCRMAYLSGKPSRTGLTGHDRQCTPADLQRSRWTFGYWAPQAGSLVKAELISLDVLHHEARFVLLIGK